MVTRVLQFLVAVVLIAILVYLTLWVLAIVGIRIPSQIEALLWVLALLLVLLYAWRLFGGYVGNPFRPLPPGQ